jgi:hypothetical protein
MFLLQMFNVTQAASRVPERWGCRESRQGVSPSGRLCTSRTAMAKVLVPSVPPPCPKLCFFCNHLLFPVLYHLSASLNIWVWTRFFTLPVLYSLSLSQVWWFSRCSLNVSWMNTESLLDLRRKMGPAGLVPASVWTGVQLALQIHC